jgi:hypothetical protein
VTVRAAALDARAILSQMEAGRFYASTGVELDSIRVEGSAMTVSVRKRGDFKYTIEFIGRGGEVLATNRAAVGTYRLKGDELYVRARVTSSGGERAWVQPVFVVKD